MHMKQTYYSPPSGSATNKQMGPKPETIQRILDFSRALKVIETDAIHVECILN